VILNKINKSVDDMNTILNKLILHVFYFLFNHKWVIHSRPIAFQRKEHFNTSDHRFPDSET
jgi:hypothetical protein